VDVDDGNIFVGSFCPKITTMMTTDVYGDGHDDVDDDGGSLV